MNILLTDLRFDVTVLSPRDNEVIVYYSGKSDVPDIILELEIQAEPNVNFRTKAGTLQSYITFVSKLTNKIDEHDEPVTINVSKKPKDRTTVRVKLFAQKGTKDQQERSGSIYF